MTSEDRQIADPPGETVDPAEWERLWLAEADRRWAEIIEGSVETVTLEEVLRRAQAAAPPIRGAEETEP